MQTPENDPTQPQGSENDTINYAQLGAEATQVIETAGGTEATRVLETAGDNAPRPIDQSMIDDANAAMQNVRAEMEQRARERVAQVETTGFPQHSADAITAPPAVAEAPVPTLAAPETPLAPPPTGPASTVETGPVFVAPAPAAEVTTPVAARPSLLSRVRGLLGGKSAPAGSTEAPKP